MSSFQAPPLLKRNMPQSSLPSSSGSPLCHFWKLEALGAGEGGKSTPSTQRQSPSLTRSLAPIQAPLPPFVCVETSCKDLTSELSVADVMVTRWAPSASRHACSAAVQVRSCVTRK